MKAHFGEALQAQLEVASASYEESISTLRYNLMEYIDAALIEEGDKGCPCQIPGKCPCVRREPENRTPRRSRRSSEYVQSDDSEVDSRSSSRSVKITKCSPPNANRHRTSGQKLAITRTQTPTSSTKGMGTIPLAQCVSVQLMHQGSTTGSIPVDGRGLVW